MLKAPCLPGLHSKMVSVSVCLSVSYSLTHIYNADNRSISKEIKINEKRIK